jgi:hypothetical protein
MMQEFVCGDCETLNDALKLKFGVKLGTESREEIYEMEAKVLAWAKRFCPRSINAHQDDYIRRPMPGVPLGLQIEPMIEQADGSSNAFRRENHSRWASKGELSNSEVSSCRGRA